MAQTPKQIEARLNEILKEIAALGPALQGTIKKNRNRRRRKDGSLYISPEHYTFVYRDTNGKECWKRINEKHLPTIRQMQRTGELYKKLVCEHARLTTQLAVIGIAKKSAEPEIASSDVVERRVDPA